MTNTEQELANWRFGQTMAERLAAGLLQIDGFASIDPQHPLGGPDGRKDILCQRDGKVWVAAAYFPTGPKGFNEIQTKFLHDQMGVALNGAEGFVFVTNQALTVGQRQALTNVNPLVEVYHLERVRHLLDQPKGCGLRLEYLRIPMTEAEQWSFWNAMNADIVSRLTENERLQSERQARIEAKLDVLVRTMALEADLLSSPSSMGSRFKTDATSEFLMSRLSVSSLCWIHRMVAESTRSRGSFRTVQSWIGSDGKFENAIFVPPAPQDVPALVDEWLLWWNNAYPRLIGASQRAVCASLAEMHHKLLMIHPFLDGNGRVAWALLDKGLDELLGVVLSDDFRGDRNEYYQSLRAADQGDLKLLALRIEACII